MATPEQRARRRAQRENKKRLDALRQGGKYQPVVPRATRKAVLEGRIKYGYDVIAGREPYPRRRTHEADNLASLASLARWGKADPIFETKFKQYWYHKDDDKRNDADIEDESHSADIEED